MGDGGPSVGGEAEATRAAEAEAHKAEAKVDARKKQLDAKQIPDDYFAAEDDKGNSSGHVVLLKHPRGHNASQRGYVSKKIDIQKINTGTTENPEEKLVINGKSELYNELLEKGVIKIIKKDGVDVPTIDVYYEWGGEDEYRKFLQDQSTKNTTGNEGLYHLTPSGIIPKPGIDAETIALAHDVWLAEKNLQELTDKQHVAEVESQQADDGNPLAGAVEAVSAEDIAQAQAKVAESQTAYAKRVEEVREEQRREDLKSKKITAEDARAMLMVLKGLNQGEKEVLKQLNNLKEEDGQDAHQLQEKLEKIRALKITEMMRAIGYSEDDIKAMRGGADSDLPLVLQLARHTSNSKDIKSQEVRDLCTFVKGELISSVQELVNRTEEEGKKSSWNTVRTMKWPQVLRKAMEAMGITGEAQDKKITELQQSTNERRLSIKSEGTKNEHGENTEDTLTVLLEALVTGEPVPDVEKSFKTYFEELHKEFAKTGKKIEEFNNWATEKIKQLHPEVGEAAAIIVTNFLEKHLDMGAFMEMLLTGDSSLSLAHDLGYKSKEQLKAEGKEPVGVEEVDTYVRANGNHAENARKLLVFGLKDIIREENREALLHRPASEVLKDKTFRELLKNTVDKEHHKIFATNILEELKFGDEKTQELKEITLTDEAFSYIMSLPFLAEKLNWQDGGGVEEKEEEDALKVEGKSNVDPKTQSEPTTTKSVPPESQVVQPQQSTTEEKSS